MSIGTTRGGPPRRWWSDLGLAAGLVLMLLTTGPTEAVGSDAHQWRRYSNPRFGFSVCYPADLVGPGTGSDNGDGETFTAANGARIAAFGSFNALHWTAKEAMQQDRSRLSENGGAITYQYLARDTFVLSGRRANQVFYDRTHVGPDRITTVEITYPASDAMIWDAVAARLGRCLQPG